MSEQINIEQIYRQERQRWLREEAPRKSLRDRISDSVPYWIIIVALVLYGLSAPHTASVFDKLTSGWGWIAPIGVEFVIHGIPAALRESYHRASIVDTMAARSTTIPDGHISQRCRVFHVCYQ